MKVKLLKKARKLFSIKQDNHKWYILVHPSKRVIKCHDKDHAYDTLLQWIFGDEVYRQRKEIRHRRKELIKYKNLNMKKSILTLVLLLIAFSSFSQIEVGPGVGYSHWGINPNQGQPVYMITLQNQYSKIINSEMSVMYSQRMIGSTIADYIDFSGHMKFGYFGRIAGAYFNFGFGLDPTIDHNNPQFHTYVSFLPGIGAQVRILPNWKILPPTIFETKIVSCTPLSAGYLDNTRTMQEYNGYMIQTILKVQITKKPFLNKTKKNPVE